MMFKEKSISKLYAFALAAVFALTLAGCGGGGGTAAVEEDPPAVTDSTPQEMCEDDGGRYNADGSCTPAADLAEEMALSGAQEAAMMAYMKAKDYVESAVDPVAMSNAYKYAAMAKEASDAAEMATTSAMAMTHQTAAEKYRDMAMEASMMDGLGITMLANRQLNKAPEDLQEQPDPPKPITNVRNVHAEINTVSQTTTPNSVGATVPTATVTYAATATEPTFTITDYEAGESPKSFSMGSFMGTELVNIETSVGGVAGRTNVVLYSDRAQTESVTNYSATATGFVANEALATGANHVTSLSEGQISGAMGDKIEGTYNADSRDNNPAVSGAFYCNAALCTLAVNSKGMVTANVGYEFRPADGKTTKDDTSYLTLGFWLTAPTALTAEGAAPGGIVAGAFGMGQGTAVEIPAALEGTATYEGIATGLYATKDGISYFSGDAMLEANFGQVKDLADDADDTTAGFRGSVSGSISNITAGGMMMEGELGLSAANIAGDTTGAYSGNTKGSVGDSRFVGSWRGTFYEAGRATTPADSRYPMSTAGTFSGYDEFNNSSILGAFGANKQ